VTKAPFARALVRKSARALKVARLALNAGDNDSAVSRSYYAMFDIARAALLRAGVAETSCHERIAELSKYFVATPFSQDKLIDNSQLS
jgi:uncharacterized protein (UPF0332 family)